MSKDSWVRKAVSYAVPFVGPTLAVSDGVDAAAEILNPTPEEVAPEMPPPPPTPEDPSVQENQKKAQSVERGQRGRRSTLLSNKAGLSDTNVFRRSLLGQ